MIVVLSLVLLNSIPNIDMIVLNFRVQETNTSGIVIHHVAGLRRHRLHIICVHERPKRAVASHLSTAQDEGRRVAETPLPSTRPRPFPAHLSKK